MFEPFLFYDRRIYRLSPEAAADLLARGVIEMDWPDYALSLQHKIEEVEPFASLVADDRPRRRRLRWWA